ncbi:uncharacterized protein LOC144209655 [Stigmatopora nigra]
MDDLDSPVNRDYATTSMVDFAKRTQHLRNSPSLLEGAYTKQSGLKRALFFSESSNRELVAQNTALRAQMDNERQSHHRERQRLQEALEEAQSQAGSTTTEQDLRDVLASAQRETAQVRQFWMEEHRLLKRTREDESENMVAALNAEWQRWWGVREREAAAQLRAQWENAQWHAEEMAAYFNAKLESVERHAAETAVYYRAELERQRWDVNRSLAEKDDVIAELRKDNSMLGNDHRALSSQVLRLEAEAAQMQRSIFRLKEELKIQREVKKTPDEERRREVQVLKDSAGNSQKKQTEVSQLRDAVAASRRETASVRRYWMSEYEQLKKSGEEATKKIVEAINGEWQQFKAEWEQVQKRNRRTSREKDRLLASFISDIDELTSRLGKAEADDSTADLEGRAEEGVATSSPDANSAESAGEDDSGYIGTF